MATVKTELEEISERDERLYEQYGKCLEVDHFGEFIAIGVDGRIVFGGDSGLGEVLREAIDMLGSGRFALRRVGYKTVGRL